MNAGQLPLRVRRFGSSDPELLTFRYSYIPFQEARAPQGSLEFQQLQVSDKSTCATRQLGFLDLPIEVRRLVYHQLGFCTNHRRKLPTSRYPEDDLNIRASYFFTSKDGRHSQRHVQRPLHPLVKGKRISTSIMRTCKRVADETYELLYGDTNIGIGWDMASQRGWYTEKPIPRVSDPALAALPFALEPLSSPSELSAAFLGSRALSFVTHITLGPLAQLESDDRTPLQAYTRMLEYLAFRCRNLKYLGIHFSDKCQIPHGGNEELRPMIQALANVVHFCKLQRVWVGSARYAYENLDIEVIRKLKFSTGRQNKDSTKQKLLAQARNRLRQVDKWVIFSDENHIRLAEDLEKAKEKLRSAAKSSNVSVDSLEALLEGRKPSVGDGSSWGMNSTQLKNVPWHLSLAFQLRVAAEQQLREASNTLQYRIMARKQLAFTTHCIKKGRRLRGRLLSAIKACIPAAGDNIANNTFERYRMLRETVKLLPATSSDLEESEPEDNASQPGDLTESIYSSWLRELQAGKTPWMIEEGEKGEKAVRNDVRLSRQALEEDLGPDSLTAHEAQEVLLEQVGKLMSSMGFKQAPAPCHHTQAAAREPKELDELRTWQP